MPGLTNAEKATKTARGGDLLLRTVFIRGIAFSSCGLLDEVVMESSLSDVS